MKQLVAKARDFVVRVYLPDLLAVAAAYKDWAGHGKGVGNYLAYGEYPDDDTASPALFIPAGKGLYAVRMRTKGVGSQ